MSKIYTLTAAEISDKVCELALTANMYLPEDVAESLRKARAAEKLGRAQSLYDEIIENAKLAADKYMPICQDCGMAVLFIELGQDLHVEGGDLEEAVNEGVRRAYREGYLRKSVVRDPLADRRNTGDNGMGSENMSRIFMLKPADGAEGVVRSVVETVREAGSNPCPPIVIGVGIGGNFETAPLAAKEALLVPCGVRNPIEYYAKLEEEILREVNKLGIGPSGCGGTVTALDAHIVTKPTHIAGMPVAVNICCHALRHAHGRIEGRG